MEHERTGRRAERREETGFPAHSLQRCECAIILECLSNRSCTLVADAVVPKAVQWEYTEGQRMKVFDFKGCSSCCNERENKGKNARGQRAPQAILAQSHKRE
jgi:hypothetical protein